MIDAAIVGFGGVACGDERAGRRYAMHHLGAYEALNERVRIIAVCDPDSSRRAVAAERIPGAQFYTDAAHMLAAEQLDVVSICSPDELHQNHLNAALDAGVRAIWCEKPVAWHADDAVALAAKALEKTAHVQVNFFRRFIPEIATVANSAKAGQYGPLLHVNAYYPDTIVHNGSHTLDMLQLFDCAIDSDTLIVTGKLKDDDDGPLHIAADFKGSGRLTLTPVPRTAYNIIEWEFLYEQARVRILESGRRLSVQSVIDDPHFPHLQLLDPNAPTLNCQWKSSFERALENLIDVSAGTEKELVSDISFSVQSVRLVGQIRAAARARYRKRHAAKRVRA